MNDTNVGSTNQPSPSDPAASGASLSSAQPAGGADSAAISEKRNRRRQLLIGGAAVGGFLTLPNVAVLAQKKKKKKGCSVSAVASQNGSAAKADVCGNSPGCWGNSNGYPTWSSTSTFMGKPVFPNHLTTLHSIFPILNTAPSHNVAGFKISGNDGCGSIIQKNIPTISVVMANGTSISLFNQGTLLNLVAGLLNGFFFGNLYPVSDPTSVIGTMFANILNDAKNNNSGDIPNQVNALLGSNGTINLANNTNSELCPP